MKFAKLFEFEDIGQVLVTTLHDDDFDYAVNFTASDGPTTWTAIVSFKTAQERDECFDKLTEADARKAMIDLTRSMLAAQQS